MKPLPAVLVGAALAGCSTTKGHETPRATMSASPVVASSSPLPSVPTTDPAPPSAEDARVRAALAERFAADPEAASVATDLWTKWGIVADVEEAHTMDGGYRGSIRIEPAVPVLAHRKHIEWIAAAIGDLDRFWTALDVRAASPAEDAPKRYRYKPLTLRFMRSMHGKRTPSAYAHHWTVAWNLEGSLHTSPDAARETLVHEIFHLNDAAHATTAGAWWSERALGADYDAIVNKCGTSRACLAPFAPNHTTVRGGTYYAFQPGNGVVEYAAELALRYYREQRAVLFALPRPREAREKSFKCGPPVNGRAWASMRDEFFGGVDVVPPCG